jgi:hypothetical protein
MLDLTVCFKIIKLFFQIFPLFVPAVSTGFILHYSEYLFNLDSVTAAIQPSFFDTIMLSSL